MSNMYNRIENLCFKNGIDVTKLCRRLDITRSCLSELKSGRAKSLSADKVIKISEYFGVSAIFITDGVESEQKKQGIRLNVLSLFIFYYVFIRPH